MKHDIIPINRERSVSTWLVTETKVLKATKGVVESLSELLLLDFSY